MRDELTEQPKMASYLPRFEKAVIYVDSREASTRNGKRVIKAIHELGAEAVVRKLDFGDFLIGADVAVERKTIFDLVGTLTHRFLFDQLFKMKEAYPKSILLIEGYIGVLRKFRRITPESLSGALFAIAYSNIPVVPTVDYKGTATFLVVAAKQLLKEKKNPLIIRHRAKAKSIRDQQLFAVIGLPHVGRVLGENLLKHFGSVRKVFAASEEELQEVKGVGQMIAGGIAGILDAPLELDERNDAEEEQ